MTQFAMPQQEMHDLPLLLVDALLVLVLLDTKCLHPQALATSPTVFHALVLLAAHAIPILNNAS